ncbi:MAG: hypothetical protein WC503_01570 [Candidatus Shapirobacteria bacterium]
MLKKHLYQVIFIVIIISSILGISKQLSLLLNARQQTYSLEQKVLNLVKRNESLKKSLNP